MSETIDTSELRLRERELQLKEEELAHRREMDKRSSRFQLSPWTTAVIALLSTGVTASVGGLWSQRADAAQAQRELALREREQQFQIVMKATENRTAEVAARNLLFFVDIGYLPDPDSAIRRKATAGQVPVITSGPAENPIDDRVQLAQSLGASPPVRVPGVDYEIRDHVLFRGDKPVSLVKTPKVGRNNAPQFIVLHSTLTRTAAPALRVFAGREWTWSVHLLVDRDGSVTQLAPFDYATWHAGTRPFRGMRMNTRSIAIDLVNAGPLKQQGSRWVSAAYNSQDSVPASEVVRPDSDGRYAAWHGYTQAQIQTVEALTRLLRTAYPSITEVVAHSEINPDKPQPGPAFPLDRVRRVTAATRS